MEFSNEQIGQQVIQSLGRCLARSSDGIKLTDTLINDLGLDSLDFLDLMFALEKTFKVKIRDADFDRLLKPTQNETLPADLLPEEVSAMARFIPALEQRAREGAVPRNSVISMMTVESLVKMVAFKLNAGRS